MDKKRAPEIKEEIIKKDTRGQAIADDGKDLETYGATSFTPAGDRVTPYEADEDLGEKGDIQE
jgi:hypothetical protein